ncbi:MAG: DUF262 domain-containing protein [Planctomycetes bacterium]|nr:DUF262 domain-containing protein [Planctomycetota bacterium]
MKYHPTIQTISWFKARADDGSLTIKPPYQRRPVWKARQKCHLIETVLLDLPIPEIYVHVKITDEGKSEYAVVDGQQRIRAILQFIGAERDEGEAQHNAFALTHLDPNAEFYNWTFDELNTDQRRRFFAYKLAVREIDDADDDEVRRIFARLNKYLTKLSPQELRNATYSGPFVKLANDLTDDEYWSENRIVSPETIRRMGDIEFISELLIGVLDGPQSGKAEIIDEYYQRFEDFTEEFEGQAELKRRFSRTLDLVQRVLPEIRDTRWRNKTDFYSLFVAFAHKLRSEVVQESMVESLGDKLMAFAAQVDKAIESSAAKVPQYVLEYAQAHVKGSSEKSRRAARHESLLTVVDSFFAAKKPPRAIKKTT